MAHDYRPLYLGCVEESQQISAVGLETVITIRFVRQPVAAQVGGKRDQPGENQMRGDQFPDASVRGQPVK
jgi:hypothetical protein